MANPKHLNLLHNGVEFWNSWRRAHPNEELDLRGAKLRGWDLSRAYLREADLSGANLRGVDLREVDLSFADLSGANLTQAVLLRANLTSADLTSASVFGARFGMADLTGLRHSPEELDFQDALKSAEEAAKVSRTLFFWLVGIFLFILLTAATATDAQLIIPHSSFSLKLPVLDVPVPVPFFFICSPILGLILFVYLHMYLLAHFYEVISELPASFPDGRPLRRKLYPWILNVLIEAWRRPPLPFSKRVKSWLSFDHILSRVGVLLGWAILPLTTAILTFRFLVRQSDAGSYCLLLILTVSIGAALHFYNDARARSTGESVSSFRRRVTWVLVLLSLVGGGYVTHLSLRGLLSATRPQVSLYKAQLVGADLRGVSLQDAILPRADLTEARLAKADFSNADLTNAILVEADLVEGILRGAKLEGANLSKANLVDADLGGAVLSRANLRNVRNLTSEQVASAKTDEATKLPGYLRGVQK